MTFDDFIELALFCLRNPSMIIRNDDEYDPAIDDLIQHLLDNSERVERLKRDYYKLYLKLDGNIYGFWVCNRFYSYLSSGYECEERRGWSVFPERELWSSKTPSRLMAMRFYKAFDTPPKPDSYILPPKETKDAKQQ